MNLPRLGIMFLIGFMVWGLTFGRSLCWHGGRRKSLVCVVMADELLGILTGMWLARSGTYTEGVACALGGAVAAWIMLYFERVNDGKGGQG